METWKINLHESISLEGKLVNLVFFRTDEGSRFAGLEIASAEDKIDEAEFPITIKSIGDDIAFSDMKLGWLAGKKVHYSRNLLEDYGGGIKVVYRLEVLEDNKTAYAEVIRFTRIKPEEIEELPKDNPV